MTARAWLSASSSGMPISCRKPHREVESLAGRPVPRSGAIEGMSVCQSIRTNIDMSVLLSAPPSAMPPRSGVAGSGITSKVGDELVGGRPAPIRGRRLQAARCGRGKCQLERALGGTEGVRPAPRRRTAADSACTQCAAMPRRPSRLGSGFRRLRWSRRAGHPLPRGPTRSAPPVTPPVFQSRLHGSGPERGMQRFRHIPSSLLANSSSAASCFCGLAPCRGSAVLRCPLPRAVGRDQRIDDHCGIDVERLVVDGLPCRGRADRGPGVRSVRVGRRPTRVRRASWAARRFG